MNYGKELELQIEKSLESYKHKRGFKDIRNRRIFQENYEFFAINFLENFLPNLKEKKILDLGSGMGGFLVAMSKRGYTIEGLEPNPDYCEIIKLRGKKNNLDVNITRAKAEEVPFGESYFDLIYCNDVLEHSDDPEKILRECFRVLKPNGSMYVTVINRFGLKDTHYHLLFINFLPRKIAEWIIGLIGIQKTDSKKGKQRLSTMHYFTYDQFSKIAIKAGFKKITDMKKYKINHPNLINLHRKRRFVYFLNKLGVTQLFYIITRPFRGAFLLFLEK
jgi:2-polyprenyl-3-methyl-5-hydroxy-6-metoxy-1,4-benzoquinol methylase